MAIIVSDLGYGYTGGGLFSEVAFIVATGEHAAIVGANGVGKSTILRLLANVESGYDGEIQIDGTVGYLQQDVGITPGMTVRELMAQYTAESLSMAARELVAAERLHNTNPEDDQGGLLGMAYTEWSDVGGWHAEAKWDKITRRVLRQSFDIAGNRPAAQLSGGERKRLALEALFPSGYTNLLLDEPDNFLDLSGKDWLIDQIRKSKKTILVVSHDRDFLARAVSKIITIEGYGGWVHGGSFANYEEVRAARVERLASDLQRWKDEERRLYRHMRWMKQRAKMNSKTSPAADAAETRWKRFVEEGQPTAPPRSRAAIIRIAGADSGRRVITCHELGIGEIVKPFNLEISFGERVVLLGRNGAGKTQLLQAFSNQSEVKYNGTITFGARVRPSYFHQLDIRPEFERRTPLEILRDHLPEGKAYSILSRYGLDLSATNAYETLSGGQRARLQIALLEIESRSLLVLDEPVDNLDIQSAEALEFALGEYEGTVICVTHDRWFMKHFARFLVLNHDGSMFEYPDLESAVGALTDDGVQPSVRPLLLSI